MNTNNKNQKEYTRLVFQQIKSHKMLYLKVLSITFVISSLIILPIPRYYNCQTTLAPELGSTGTEGKISSIASSMGLNLGTNVTTDAISPSLYPDIIKSNDFILSLANISIKTKRTKGTISYFNYLKDYQKGAFYIIPITWCGNMLKKTLLSDKATETNKRINPYILTKTEYEIFEKIKSKTSCKIDIKTDLITISVEDQEPIVAAIIADSVRVKLQNFITKYRTSKAQTDLNYYRKLTIEAKQKYEKSRLIYANYADTNSEIILQSFKSKRDDLENDMQLKYNTYTALNNQLQTAMAKLQERTPAFTIVQRVSVPVKPAGPKRMAFIAAMMMLSLLFTTAYTNRHLLFSL